MKREQRSEAEEPLRVCVQNVSVCTGKTPRMLNTWERFDSAHGGALDVHVLFTRMPSRATPHRHTRATNAHCTPDDRLKALSWFIRSHVFWCFTCCVMCSACSSDQTQCASSAQGHFVPRSPRSFAFAIAQQWN